MAGVKAPFGSVAPTLAENLDNYRPQIKPSRQDLQMSDLLDLILAKSATVATVVLRTQSR